MSKATEKAAELIQKARAMLGDAELMIDDRGEPDQIAQVLAEAGDSFARAIAALDSEYRNFGNRVHQEAVMLSLRAEG